MAAEAGRDLDMYWKGSTSGTRIACREKGLTLNGEPIDITADDNSGWRTLLASPAQRNVGITLSGVAKDDTLRDDWFNDPTLQQDVDFIYEDGSQLSGTFQLVNYNETAAYNDAIMFDAELQSTGAITYTSAT